MVAGDVSRRCLEDLSKLTTFDSMVRLHVSFERTLRSGPAATEPVRPGLGLPLGPLTRTLTWSQEQAEKKQAELIGMSTVVETNRVVL